MASLPTVFYGAVINPETLKTFSALPRCLLAIAPSGEIAWMVDDVPDSMVQEVMAKNGCTDANVIPLRTGEFLMPGFIDTHTHAPQVPNLGSGGQYELLDWLQNVTFPMESKFADLDFARRTYESVVRRVIDCGTTTCCYYATLHLEPTKILADIIHSYGQRAFVGKCNMNRHCPDHYIEESEEISMKHTNDLITYIQSLPPAGPANGEGLDPLVYPILTPRFAISCESTLLASLGARAAAEPTIHIQTHISENPSEVAFTKSLFPKSTSYAGVYDDHGLLRNNTILAHAVHLESQEMDLIKSRNAGISHCPTSNFNLSSGVAPVGEFLDRGIKVGLGTDVSGGFCPSILTAIQHASMAAKVRACQASSAPTLAKTDKFADRQLSLATLLHMATLGGAEVCCIDNRVGSFATGKAFDALVVSVRNDAGNPALWGHDIVANAETAVAKEILETMMERFFFCGDDRNIRQVYVHGKLVGGTEFSA